MSSLLGHLMNRAPVAYSPRRAQTFPTLTKGKSSVEQALESMGSVGTLFAILDKTTTGVAEVEWKLYRKARSGLKEDRREVTRHAALDLWNNPNKFMPRQEFVEVVQQHMDLTGEMWWVVGRNPAANIPLELWPVRPDRMEPVPDPENFLKGYIYTSPDGEKIPLDLDEVIFVRKPDPCSPYRGLGPVQSVMTDLGITASAASWSRNFFRNSAQPGGIIQIESSLSDEEFDELRTRWDEQHRGVANAHRVAILEHGQWVNRSFTMQEMEFTELRNLSREIIREAFSFPKPLLGTVDDTNRANMEAAEVTFARHTVRPRLERIRQALNNDLLPLFGSAATNLEFDFEDPVEADEAQDTEILGKRVDAAVKLIGAHFVPESVLEALELPEMAWKAPEPPPALAGPQDPEDPDEGVSDPDGGQRPATAPSSDQPQAAVRYVVHAEDDANTCAPCKAQDGRRYASRAAAEVDYPGLEGYVRCVGARYGNHCRCVVRRRSR